MRDHGHHHTAMAYHDDGDGDDLGLMCKIVHDVSLPFRAIIYICLVLVISVAEDLHSTYATEQPQSYWSNKDNFINIYFVKFSWGWTVTMLGLLVFITRWVHRPFSRLAVSGNMPLIYAGNGVIPEGALTRNVVKFRGPTLSKSGPPQC